MKQILLFIALFLFNSPWTRVHGQIVRHLYTADPSAHVWADGRLYVYPSHDVFPPKGCDRMDQYHVFSTADMVEWTDHGQILESAQVPWGRPEGGFMWAPDCAYRNGTYYFYFPHPSGTDWNRTWKTGIATSRFPDRDFTVQGYLALEGDPHAMIDPCVFTDDDGQAYFYYGGGGRCKAARLKDNMMETDGPLQDMTGLEDFHEGAWVHKRRGIYYLSYADNTPRHNRLRYATGPSPLGPWTYRGILLDGVSSDTSHGSVVEFRGQSYLFYHTGDVSGQGNLRSVTFDKLYYNPDGSIRTVVQTPSSALPPKANRFTDWVDPFIGSGGHGHVFVGAGVPFGAVQVGPSNFFKGWDWCSGYNYRDSVITGFPQLHLSGTGIGDLGDVLLMPYCGEVKWDKGNETERYSGYASRFSHRNETARPGYYRVKLDDYNIDVELTATERVAYHKYHFPPGENARVIIDLAEGINDQSTGTQLELVDPYTIKGYRCSEGWAKRQQVFFAIRLNVPVTGFRISDGGKTVSGKKATGKALKGVLSFAPSPETVQLKVGISPVSADNALENIRAEIPQWNFNEIAAQANGKWNDALSKIEVETKNNDHKRIFYTALFHAMIHPSLFNDANGEYRGSDWKNYPSPGFDNYTIFSTWDTYRAAHPLYTLIEEKRTADMVNSMLAIFDQTGALPVWHLRGYDTGTMVGNSSFEIVAEACLKNIRGIDAERAFNALKATATSDLRGLNFDRERQVIPSDVMTNRPVAMALEYAIGNASIALLAKKLGKTADYHAFAERAKNYKLYYDSHTGFFRGKMADGSWNPKFHPIKSVKPWATDYAEGNPWQYLWLVPQDVEGLIDLLGGETAFEDRLDTFLTLDSGDDPDVLVDLTGCIGQLAHGNEPSHHIAYLYSYLGKPWKTARLVNYILTHFYKNDPDGIIGNEDCGQMSAWYIFSSLGFYPVFTASGQYVLGSPLFDKATVRLENGKTFTVEAINLSPGNSYIQSAELNGKAYDFSYIRHEAIMQGGTLRLRMGSTPNYRFGEAPETRPHSPTKTGGQTVFLSQPFVRPGMAQSAADLDFMREKVREGAEPWKPAFEKLKEKTPSGFVPQAFSFVSEGPYGENSVGGREFSQSAEMAYNNAPLWYITQDEKYARKAVEILNAWSYKLRSFDANNAKLNVGLSGYYFLNAAEIIRFSFPDWKEADREQFERMVLTVLYPTIEDFFTEANGNWDASMISTMLCIGVYTENRAIFNRAVDRFYWGANNGGITKYIYPGGQTQEATRDWDHVQLGIGEFAKAAQTAQTQGLDFYSVAGDRLAHAFEQTARMMLGTDMAVFGVLSKRGMEKYKDVYESIYDYYSNVRGVELLSTKEVIDTQTRARFPVGTLTGIRTYPATDRPAPAALPEADYLKPTGTGALPEPSEAVPAGAVLVRPEEDLQEIIDRNRDRTIVLSRGVHTLHAPLKVYSGLTLAGHGKETILFLAPSVNAETMVCGDDSLTNFTLRDLLIEGAVSVVANNDPNHDRRGRSYMSAASREGVVLRSEKGGAIRDLLFEHVTVQNFTQNGVLLVGASNIRILHCDFSDNGSSVVPGAGLHHNLNLSQVENVTISHSRFDASPFGCGIAVLLGKNISISGCEAARNKLSGIRCAESEDLLIEHSLAEGNDRDGIAVEHWMQGCRKVKLNHNLTQNNGRYGIYTGNAALLNASGNTGRFNRGGDRIETKPAPDPRNPDYAEYPLQEWEKAFAGFRFGTHKGLPYRLLSPPGTDPQKKYPLVLFLHGAGERGVDNRRQFYRFHPVPFWETEACFVLAPQCPSREDTEDNAACVWVDTPFGAAASTMKETPAAPLQQVISLLDSILRLPQVDKDRVYITGLSMGGFATWELLQRFPEKFAAAIPVCGGGDPAYAGRLVNTPVWAFHGDEDRTVLPERSREMVCAITEAQGKAGTAASPRYTEYKGVGHGAWSPAYADPEVWKWLFEQKK
ncbi:MAG: GH92 family glycosyl hydrolase [Dysgonamonadaceae bacterium]|jgi:predicted alpha-1,2-mannosidase|nr:GH92 family glycosyl hydrolase [Dysgonamonadaceae bacterium]